MLRLLGHGLAPGLVMLLIGVVFHVLVPIVAPSVAAGYANAALFRPWPGWVQGYMILHPFIVGVALTAGYRLLNERTGGRRIGGIPYCVGIFLLGGLPVFVLESVSLNLPLDIVVSWVIQNGSQMLGAGWVLGWLSERKCSSR